MQDRLAWGGFKKAAGLSISKDMCIQTVSILWFDTAGVLSAQTGQTGVS